MLPIRCTNDDADLLTQLMADAFRVDPVWSWVFSSQDHLAAYWCMFVRGALRHGYVFRTSDWEAAAVMVPPRQASFLEEDSRLLAGFFRSCLGDRYEQVMAFLDNFDANRPVIPHFYLGLLATHRQHAGRGLGMGLLRSLLAMDELAKAHVYLEVSNQNHVPRYAQLGFQAQSTFAVPGEQVVVTGMLLQPGGKVGL